MYNKIALNEPLTHNNKIYGVFVFCLGSFPPMYVQISSINCHDLLRMNWTDLNADLLSAMSNKDHILTCRQILIESISLLKLFSFVFFYVSRESQFVYHVLLSLSLFLFVYMYNLHSIEIFVKFTF